MKRSDQEIISDLQQVQAELSPERLHRDGEASDAEVKQTLKALRQRQAKLHAELGRQPTLGELGYW